jgi:hypothetical protein
MKLKISLTAAAVLLLAAGLVFAQTPPQGAPVPGGDAEMQAPAARGNPPALPALPQISKDIQRKIIQLNVKFTRDNAQLKAG